MVPRLSGRCGIVNHDGSGISVGEFVAYDCESMRSKKT